MKKYIILTLVLLFLITFIPSKGVAMGSAPNYKEQIMEKYKKIDLSDGDSKEEATIIAQNYLFEKGIDKDCIIAKTKVMDKEWWIPDGCWEIRFGVVPIIKQKQGLEWFSVYIDKISGEIKGSGWGPDS